VLELWLAAAVGCVRGVEWSLRVEMSLCPALVTDVSLAACLLVPGKGANARLLVVQN